MRKIRVLIADDSVIIRHILWKVFREDQGFDVLEMATNGQDALDKIRQHKPDVVTLDIEMPVLDGIATLEAARRIDPSLPIIVLSSHSEHGALITLEALSHGAADYVPKPAQVDSPEAGLEYIRDNLLPKIKAVCAKRLGFGIPDVVAPPRASVTVFKSPASNKVQSVDVVAIGSSVGGPNALAALLPQLMARFPTPILISQHMPPMFTKLLAQRLASRCELKVAEAVQGGSIVPGSVYLAPGACHMTVERHGTTVVTQLHEGDLPGGVCRPSVDIMFRSVAAVYGSRTLAVVLSGMGNDGLVGCKAIHEAGGRILVQDKETSVVWGMPGFVAAAGLAEEVLALNLLGAAVSKRAQAGRA